MYLQIFFFSSSIISELGKQKYILPLNTALHLCSFAISSLSGTNWSCHGSRLAQEASYDPSVLTHVFFPVTSMLKGTIRQLHQRWKTEDRRQEACRHHHSPLNCTSLKDIYLKLSPIILFRKDSKRLRKIMFSIRALAQWFSTLLWHCDPWGNFKQVLPSSLAHSKIW